MLLKITKRMRKHAIQKWGASDDATDAELSRLYGQKLFKNAISTADIEAINDGTYGNTGASGKKGKTDPKPKKGAPPAPPAPVDPDALEKAVNAQLRKHGVIGKPGDVDPATAFSKATRIRVKEAAENYSTSRKEATYPMTRSVDGKQIPHPLAGQQAKCGDVLLDHPSERDKAVALAYTRWCAQKNNLTGQPLPRWLRMTEHDRELMMYALHNEKWVGNFKDGDDNSIVVKRRKLSEHQIKTVLDDSVSGGIEITPVVFDDALILTPVLQGELFPHVNVQTIAKGRRVKGAAMVNPTFTSGTAEGTAITPFNTADFVTAFDTPIYPAVSAIELGQDFEEDSPVNLGGQIVEQFGLKALEWLDRVIAVGNGYNEPLGFFNSTAATLVNSTFGAGGPFTVSDFEALLFGVSTAFRREAGAMLAYVSNDYTYRKARAIKVGEGDQRRVFGMDHQGYTILGTPYKVQNDIPDGYASFVNLRRYRMYRRLGMQVRVETGGRQLALSNTRLLVVRMRYGGQPDRGGAFALMKDGAVM